MFRKQSPPATVVTAVPVRAMHSTARLRLLGLAACLALSAPGLQAAPVDDARTALAAGIEEVSAVLRAQPAQADLVASLDTLADRHFAFTTATRLAVGRDWRDFTPEQQSRAVELFSRLVIRTYADRINGQTQPQISYGAPTELRADRVEVPSTITTGGQTYSVLYRLELDRASQPARWRVYDVVAEGVSLIANYRSQFEPILRRSGAAGLISTLETKLAEAPAAPAAAP